MEHRSTSYSKLSSIQISVKSRVMIIIFDVQVVQREYERIGAVLDLRQLLVFESDTITLDIPIDGLTTKSWTIKPQMHPVVSS